MNENVLDILMYLFENYLSEPLEEEPDQQTLENELLEAGFTGPKVRKAFTWLEGLTEQQAEGSNTASVGPSAKSIRILTSAEAHKLTQDARGLLTFLEDTGVIDGGTRELVIERVMALDSEEIDIEALSWVLLMILHNQPDQEGAYVWVEDMIFERLDGIFH